MSLIVLSLFGAVDIASAFLSPNLLHRNQVTLQTNILRRNEVEHRRREKDPNHDPKFAEKIFQSIMYCLDQRYSKAHFQKPETEIMLISGAAMCFYGSCRKFNDVDAWVSKTFVDKLGNKKKLEVAYPDRLPRVGYTPGLTDKKKPELEHQTYCPEIAARNRQTKYYEVDAFISFASDFQKKEYHENPETIYVDPVTNIKLQIMGHTALVHFKCDLAFSDKRGGAIKGSDIVDLRTLLHKSEKEATDSDIEEYCRKRFGGKPSLE